jgi:hypothetical protein
VESTVAALERSGARLSGGIVRGAIPRGGGIVVETAGARVTVGELHLLLVQTSEPRATWTFDNIPEAPTSELNFVLHRAPDLEDLLRFWGPDGLGMPLVHSTPVGGEAIARSYGTAPGLAMDNAILGSDRTARLELQGPPLDRSDAPEDPREGQWPGRALGPLLWRATLPALPTSWAGWCQARGVHGREPRSLSSPHFGGRLVTLLQGVGQQRVQIEVAR